MLEPNNVYCGDCIDMLQSIPNGSVDLVLTDIPYGIDYHSNRYVEKNPFEKIKNDDALFCPTDLMWDKVKSGGAMFIFYSHKVPLVDERIKNVLIWVKNNWTAGDLKGDFGNQYECIAFMPKGNFELKTYRYSNVMVFDKVPPSALQHPTEKPLLLLKRLIEAATNEGDVVLDPFMGSGSTCVACKQMGRKYIGIDIVPEYVEVAQKRLERANNRTIVDFFN